MDFDNLLKNYISRIIAFVLMPILLPVTAAIANWVQDGLGIDLDGTNLAVYIVAVVTGVALAGFQWLRGRAQWETVYGKAKEIEAAGTAAQRMSGTTPGLPK